MCLQGGTTAIHKISNKKLNTFSICKYAKTVNFCLSYALVDGLLETGHHVRKSITHDTMLERVSA